jgi:chromosome partitioning protein
MLFKHLSAIRSVLEEHLDNFDYILIDTHPETSDLLRSVIYASDYAVSPVKLDELSSVGVPSAIEAVNGVNDDVNSLQPSLAAARRYSPTEYAGAIGMMAREYSGALKRTERSQYRRLDTAGGVFDSYVTEGDGIRKAAERRVPVYDLPTANAKKQTEQFRSLVAEFLNRCP